MAQTVTGQMELRTRWILSAGWLIEKLAAGIVKISLYLSNLFHGKSPHCSPTRMNLRLLNVSKQEYSLRSDSSRPLKNATYKSVDRAIYHEGFGDRRNPSYDSQAPVSLQCAMRKAYQFLTLGVRICHEAAR